MKRQNVGIRRQNEESGSSQTNETKRLKVFHSQDRLEADSGSDTDEEYADYNRQGKLKTSPTSDDSFSNPDTNTNNLLIEHPNKPITISENTQEMTNNYTNGNHDLSGKDHPKNDTSFVVSQASAFESYSEQNLSHTYHMLPEHPPVLNMQENLTPDALQQMQDNQLVYNTEMQIPSLNDYSESQSVGSASFQASANVGNGHCSENEQEAFNLHPVAESEIVENLPVMLDKHENTSFYNAFEQNQTDTATTNQDNAVLFPPQPEIESDENALSDLSQSHHNMQRSLDSCQSKPSEESTNTPQVGQNYEAGVSKVKVDVENITFCELKVTLLEGHADVVYSVDVDREYILSSSGDTTVKVWNVEEMKVISNFAGHNASVTSVILLTEEQSAALKSKLNLSSESRIALSASYDCHVRIWSVADGQELASMYTFNSITHMGYLQEQMYVVVGTEGGKLEVWDLCSAKIVHFTYAHESAVTCLKVENGYIYSTSKDGAVKVWLFEEEELQPLYTRRRKETSLDATYFGPTQWQAVAVHNDFLYLGDSTRHLKVLDWRLGRLRLMLNQPDEDGICEATLTKNKILLSTFYSPSSDTGGINVWKLPDMTYVGTLTGDLQEICSLAMVESGERLRIVSGGHQLLVWDFDFSKPPNKNAKDPFFVCEVENVGAEVNEESISKIIPIQPDPAKPTVEVFEQKKSWCNIS